MPDHAKVYESGSVAFITESHLKVMLGEDYVALSKQKDSAESFVPAKDETLSANASVIASAEGTKQSTSPEQIASQKTLAMTGTARNDTNSLGSEIIREIVLPEIEKEINEGKNFAKLRQIYQSMIMAAWFKRKLKDGMLSKIYIGTNKVTGIDLEDKDSKQKIYDQYLEAFKKGVYNYIKEEYNEKTQESVPHKYFSGGFAGKTVASSTVFEVASSTANLAKQVEGRTVGKLFTAIVTAQPIGLEASSSSAIEELLRRNGDLNLFNNNMDILLWLNKVLNSKPDLFESIPPLNAIKDDLETAKKTNEILKKGKSSLISPGQVQAILSAPDKVRLTLKEIDTISEDLGGYFRMQGENTQPLLVDRTYKIADIYAVFATIKDEANEILLGFNDLTPDESNNQGGSFTWWQSLRDDPNGKILNKLISGLESKLHKKKISAYDIAKETGIDIFGINYIVYSHKQNYILIYSLEPYKFSRKTNERRSTIIAAVHSLEEKGIFAGILNVSKALQMPIASFSGFKKEILQAGETWDTLGVKSRRLDTSNMQRKDMEVKIRESVANLSKRGIRPSISRVADDLGEFKQIIAFLKKSDYPFDNLGIQKTGSQGPEIYKVIEAAVKKLKSQGTDPTIEAVDGWIKQNYPKHYSIGWLPNPRFNSRQRMIDIGIVFHSESPEDKSSSPVDENKSAASAAVVELEFPVFSDKIKYVKYDPQNVAPRRAMLEYIEDSLNNAITAPLKTNKLFTTKQREGLIELHLELMGNAIDAVMQRLDRLAKNQDARQLDLMIKKAQIKYSYREDPGQGIFEITFSDTGYGIDKTMLLDWAKGKFKTTKPFIPDDTEERGNQSPYLGHGGFGIPHLMKVSRENAYTLSIVSKTEGDSQAHKFSHIPNEEPIISAVLGDHSVGTTITITGKIAPSAPRVDIKKPNNLGGIDMNSKALDLETTGEGIKFDMPFDPAQLENIKIDGFTPVILQIIPTNLPLFIGINEPEKETQLSAR